MFDVQVHGSGDDDLVMLYGTPVPAESLEPVVEEFADEYRIIIPETCAIGIPPAEALPRLEQTLEEAAVNKPIVLGHSLGAYRAFQLALSDNIAVDRVVTVGPLADIPDERQQQYDEMAKQLDAGEVDLAQVALQLWFRPEYLDENPGTRDQIQRWFEEMGDQALKEALLYEMPRQDLHSRLGEIEIPACVIVGEADEATPPEWSEKIAGLLPDSRFHLIQNSGHFPFCERPDVTARILRSFLRE